MSLRFGVLGLLKDHPMTGYEIYHYFSDFLSPMWFAQQSQVYRELGVLEKEGFVTSHIEPQVGKPDKRLYQITESGGNALTAWVGTYDFWESMRHRDSFALRIFFTGHMPHLLPQFISQLEAYIDENSRMLDHLRLQELELEENLEAATLRRDFAEEDRLFFFKLSLMRGKSQYEMNRSWATEVLVLCQQRITTQQG